MIKRFSALLIALAMFLSVTACSMPQSIFPDGLSASPDDEVDDSTVDVYDFTFTVFEQEFSLPLNFSAMSARGWSLPEPVEAEETEEAVVPVDEAEQEQKVYYEDTLLAPGESSEYVTATKNGSELELKLYNDTNSETELKLCTVIGLRLSAENSKLPEVQLVGGLQIGNLYENIVTTYGMPSFEKELLASTGELSDINDVVFIKTNENTEKTKTIYYSITDSSFVGIELGDYNGATNSAVCITIENDTPTEEEYDYSKDIKKVPDVIELYKEPSLLGKTFSDFAFKYEKNLYTLPIPVRELVNDGWVFVRGASMKVARGNTADGVVMRKGNLAVSLLVHNYDTKNNNTPINCYAVSLTASIVGPNVELMLPKGIALGSDENDLRSILNLAQLEYESIDGDEETVDDIENSEDDAADVANTADDTSVTVDDESAEDAVEDDGSYVEVTNNGDYTVYSYIMPDDVPTVQLPVSVTDVGDFNADLLGAHRKHIDIYVSNSNHKVVYVYMQNCPEYVVDEAAIWAQQIANVEQ